MSCVLVANIFFRVVDAAYKKKKKFDIHITYYRMSVLLLHFLCLVKIIPRAEYLSTTY